MRNDFLVYQLIDRDNNNFALYSVNPADTVAFNEVAQRFNFGESKSDCMFDAFELLLDELSIEAFRVFVKGDINVKY